MSSESVTSYLVVSLSKDLRKQRKGVDRAEAGKVRMNPRELEDPHGKNILSLYCRRDFMDLMTRTEWKLL